MHITYTPKTKCNVHKLCQMQPTKRKWLKSSAPKAKNKNASLQDSMYTSCRLQRLSHSQIDEPMLRCQPTAYNRKFWPSCLRRMPHIVAVIIHPLLYFHQLKVCDVIAPFSLINSAGVAACSLIVGQPATHDTSKLFTLKHITTSSTSWNSHIITKLKSLPSR